MNGRLRHQGRPFRFEAGRPASYNLEQVMQQGPGNEVDRSKPLEPCNTDDRAGVLTIQEVR